VAFFLFSYTGPGGGRRSVTCQLSPWFRWLRRWVQKKYKKGLDCLEYKESVDHLIDKDRYLAS